MTGVAIVGWKETPEASRALAAAMPQLRGARRVFLVSVEEDQAATLADLEHLARQLQWNGIAAEPRFISDKSTEVSRQLMKLAAETHADLLVVGGYGHRPLREAVYGGVTRALIESADLPILMMH
jgi:nucleotide-binding universal stress UspA family protein